jgi:serine protease Do
MQPGKFPIPTFRRLGATLAMLAAFGGGYALHGHVKLPEAHGAIAQQPAPGVPGAAADSAVQVPDFSAIAAAQGPAVVNVSVSGSMKTAAAEVPGLDPDSPFYEFFRRFGVPGRPGRVPTHGLGSGFIVDPDGTILTNAHVVADADEVIVKLTDKREFKAKLVGLDKQTDVAVLRIDARNLPAVKIGNPDQARVGEWVVAIG